jgi:S-DNA-T family DNA segregation ATPase FtsK/SpoIIIE
MVYLRGLLEDPQFKNAKSPATCAVGKSISGENVYIDIAKMPHLLVAGATGMGKSVCINAILISMLYKARPDEVKLILVDPKKVEFNVYNGIPHLLIPVVTDPKQAAGALMWAVEQMEKRYDMIEKLCVRNIEAYNAKVKENPALGEPMPKIVIVIDELNDLMIQVRDPVENLIMSIAQKARAAGIHLIIGTQRPSVNVITGVIKANIPSRISCKVSASVDSRTILERAGAEKLLNNGDMLFHPVGLSDPIRVQGAFVTDAEVEAVMEALKKQNKGNSYDEQAIEDINRAAKKCSKKKDSDFDEDDGDDESAGEGYLNDQKFLDAVDVAIKNQKIATSLIQRKLSIGYGKAAKYIDVMESLGIVGEANGPKPREVLITMDEWHEMLARRDLD